MEDKSPGSNQKDVKRKFFPAYLNVFGSLIIFILYLIGRQHHFEDSHRDGSSIYYSVMRHFNWLALANLLYAIYLFYKIYKLNKHENTDVSE